MLLAWKPWVLAALALAFVAAPAQARVPAPAGLTVHFAPCPGLPDAPGCSDPEAGEVYVKRRADRWTLAHETGHVYLERLGPYWKGALVDRLGLRPGGPWDRGTGDVCWRLCPSETAADVYAACALGLDPRPRRVWVRGHGWGLANPRAWQSQYGYEPTRRHHRRLCDVIRRSALDPLRR